MSYIPDPYTDPYNFGRIGEIFIANILAKNGWKVVVHEGSRGAADIEAYKESKRWYIQVKRTNKNVKRVNLLGQQDVPVLEHLHITKHELARLKRVATYHNTTPVLAFIYNDCIVLYSARTFKPLYVLDFKHHKDLRFRQILGKL